MSLGDLLFKLLLCGLVIQVLIQSAFQFKKYASNQRTIARSSQIYSELHMPAISFCLGYDKEKILQLPWLQLDGDKQDDRFPATKDKAREVWEDVTLDVEEVGVVLTHSNPLSGTNNKHDIVAFLRGFKGPNDCFRAEEHNTLSGKCYTLDWRCPVNPEYLRIYFSNLTMLSQSRLKLYFHDIRDTMGLNRNFWHTPVTTSEIFLYEFTDMPIQKCMMRRATSVSEDKYFQCVEDAMLEWGDQLDNASLCEFPAFQSILKRVNKAEGTFPACPNASSYQDTVENFRLFFRAVVSSNCTKPDKEVSFEVSQRSQMTAMSQQMTVVDVYYPSMEVRTEEEYVLLDFPAMLAAVGGFMGMMLGWSAKDLARLMTGIIDKCFKS